MGDATATAHRRPYYLEILAYLVLHPKGSPPRSSPRTSASVPEGPLRPERLRRWLGQNRSGEPYLPRAQQTHQDGVPATYALDGVLSDLDLFRRLRARGQSRGAEGMDDLVSALHLVSGEPFTDLRKDGWGWLLEGERLDHIMTTAIVDVGHIVTTHALADGDLDLADSRRTSHSQRRRTTRSQPSTAPRSSAPRATSKEPTPGCGATSSTERDDELGPIQLPPRTAEVVERKRPSTTGRRRTG